jgi:hypothetical protein
MRFKCFLGPRAIFYCNIHNHNQIENVRNPSQNICPQDRDSANDMERERKVTQAVSPLAEQKEIGIQKTLLIVSSIQLNTNNSNATRTQHMLCPLFLPLLLFLR